MEVIMDRRQRKTREAIFQAFTEILSEKNVGKITVGEIINRADIGRATFYAHFPTKDFLVKELCEELFCHIFDTEAAEDEPRKHHKHIFQCDAPDSVFLHLFQHLKQNDNHILELLTGKNNELFSGYFTQGLTELIVRHLPTLRRGKPKGLPDSFWANHITTTFLGTVRWWVSLDLTPSPTEIHQYFLLALHMEDE